MPEFFIVFFIGVVLLLPFCFLAALAQDRLTRRLHDSFPEAWRSAGAPIGWFWRPPEGKSVAGQIAFMKATLWWVFRLPKELVGDRASTRDQLILRACLAVWNVGCIGLFAFVLTRYGFPPKG